MDYTTVFEIRNIAPTEEFPYLLFPVIGVVALILGLAGFVYRTRRNERRSNLRQPRAAIIVGVVCLALTPIILGAKNADDLLEEKYKSGEFQTIEGVVRVIRTQPESGHAPGDLIGINGMQFEIDHFGGTIGYEATISNGGDLKGNVLARISYVGGNIVRVEVREAVHE